MMTAVNNRYFNVHVTSRNPTLSYGPFYIGPHTGSMRGTSLWGDTESSNFTTFVSHFSTCQPPYLGFFFSQHGTSAIFSNRWGHRRTAVGGVDNKGRKIKSETRWTEYDFQFNLEGKSFTSTALNDTLSLDSYDAMVRTVLQ